MRRRGPRRIEAEKLAKLPEYLFTRINNLKMRARRNGLDVVDLGMGNPDRPTPSHIVEKLCEVVRNPKRMVTPRAEESCI